MRPLFLLSLPRAGSTLVQRVLAAHSGVATTAEPHILLPLVYSGRATGARADYWHEAAVGAIGEFVGQLDSGRDAWRAEIRAFAERLYARAGGDQREYFLDKTPRYHVIVSELIECFPDARFVLLWRHPLAVVASLLETFRAGRFEPYHFHVDLYGGVHRLVAASASDRVYVVRYEDLATGNQRPWRRLFAELSLEFDPELLNRFGEVRLKGAYGDPTARDALSDASVEKWRSFVRGPVRVAWCRRYLRWIGKERMTAMGYDLEATLRALARPQAMRGGALRDAGDLVASFAASRVRRAALRLPEGPRPLGPQFEA